MLHSASRNLLRTLRIITNPPVSLKSPFNYNRANPEDYSLVEQKTLRDLGKPAGLGNWKIAGPRERIVPKERVEVSNRKVSACHGEGREGSRNGDKRWGGVGC